MAPNNKRIAVGHENGTVKIWDIPTKTCVITFSGIQHSFPFLFPSFFPLPFFSPSHNPLPLLLIFFNKLTGHKSGVTTMSFSPTNDLLVTGSQDTQLVVWDLMSECGVARFFFLFFIFFFSPSIPLKNNYLIFFSSFSL